MNENSTLIRAGDAGAPAVPAFLTDHAPTRYRQRWTPLSRSPATARLGEVWQVAALADTAHLQRAATSPARQPTVACQATREAITADRQRRSM